jgi:KUP system potassium uptake protein
VQLGYSPRVDIDYTSADQQGQIYVPQVNWALMLSTIGLVIGFKSSSNLAARASLTMTMVITTICAPSWPEGLAEPPVAAICGFFRRSISRSSGRMLKIVSGWFPLVVATVIFTLMTTWKRGRALVAARLGARAYPFEKFMEHVLTDPPRRVPGTAVFMTGTSGATPPALLHNLAHNKVLHEQVVLCTVTTADVPIVTHDEHVLLVDLGRRFYRITMVYGFTEQPMCLRRCARPACLGSSSTRTRRRSFLGRETILATRTPGMALWREKLFDADVTQRRPRDRVLPHSTRARRRLGMQLEI